MSETSFQPEGYLRFDLSQGTVSTTHEQRCLVVPEELIKSLVPTKELERAARRWGEKEALNLMNLIGEKVLEGSPERFISELSLLMATMGWGWCDLESWGGVLFAVVEKAPQGDAVKILMSFLEGVFSKISGMNFRSLHISTATPCRFLLTSRESVMAIQDWLDQGATLPEIVKRMHAGEHYTGPAQGGQ